MKRPLLIAAVIVLSGTVCGLKETPMIIRTAAVCITAAFFLYLISKLRGRTAAAAVIVMTAAYLLGYGRAAYVSRMFHMPAAEVFFSRYEATNPGQFDYAMYLKGLGVGDEETYSRMQGETEEDEDISGSVSVRKYCEGLLDKNLSEHDARMYKAILLGQKSDLDPEVRKLYQSAGISHLLAVSGLHVGMLGMGFYGALRRWKLGRRHAGITAGAVMVFYALVTGASASTVRAVIMLLVSFAAAAAFRTYDMLSSLSLALAVLLLWRPYQVFQSGFQLSFGAVFAIASFCKALASGTERMRLKAMRPGSRQKRIPKDARLPTWISALIMGAGIQLFTLPLILWHYFVFPPYAVLLNLIVIPLMSAALGSGVAVTGISFLNEGIMIQAGKTIAQPVNGAVIRFIRTVLFAAAAGPGHYILRLYEFLGKEMMRLPFASVCPGRPALVQILAYYILIGLMTSAYLANSRKPFRPGRRPDSTAEAGDGIITGSIGMDGEKASGHRIRAFVYAPALVLIAGLTANSLTLRHIRPDCLTVTAIDVGQGDGFLVETPKQCFLIDSGSSSNRKFGENILEPLLLSKGITELEFAAVSHGDIDHTSGIKYLLEDTSPVRIRRLVLPGPARDNENYDELTGQKEIIYLEDGLLIASDGRFLLRCIYAGNTDFPEDMNRNSTALLLEAGMFSMLFTGDMAKEDEAGLTGQYGKFCGSMPVTVLKVAHHGSSTSTGDELLEAVRPRYALISAGRKNRYGHPSEEVTAKLKDHGAILLETAKSGAVEISVKEDRMEIRRFLGKCADDSNTDP